MNMIKTKWLWVVEKVNLTFTRKCGLITISQSAKRLVVPRTRGVCTRCAVGDTTTAQHDVGGVEKTVKGNTKR